MVLALFSFAFMWWRTHQLAAATAPKVTNAPLQLEVIVPDAGLQK